MKALNKVLFYTLIITLNLFYFVTSYSQTSIKECSSYECLYNTVKSGFPASYNKTAYINSYKLIEKSFITIEPVISVDSFYKITYKITDLEKGKKKSKYEEGSVLGFLVADCKDFEKNYEKFIGTSCGFITDRLDDAINAAENGITFEIDQKYPLEGDLVLVYEKVCKKIDPDHHVVKKPAVYLYPIETSNIKVNVEVNGKLTYTEPLYGKGWNVNVTPNGLINGKYDYLFYEADLKKIELPEEGWIVEYNKIENWFDEYLPKLGLNEKEKEQFKEYWLKDLKEANYYEIKILGDKFLKENMNLVISPEPKTIIRLNLHFKPVYEKREITQPVISTPVRDGFTVVEWGGINASDNALVIP